ncbi:MAG: acetyl-CoA synthetase [Candidatus Korarchaeota archaeon]|nr:acetyl-CoA synthetase [Candidatus Korarchaeota archaeon]NIU84445.1 acetyl-CoA synthetase [Candidatus Thorarchaeota archaeon]NIW12928.1 acetyl-CoA synthetase [Candidatus Thorarchaeota archaeon]NIW51892.1 acetyl-CoA synthetase [Candidatus Korarchaeota archaeon]
MAVRAKRGLPEQEARKLLAEYGISFPKHKLAKTRDEAIEIASEIGYPLVMKIVSPDVLHKTDVGGVKLHITNKKEVSKVWEDIMESVKRHEPDAEITGIFLEEEVEGGHEIIIGGTRDPVFGPTIMFGGVGGIYVELFDDVSFRLAPIAEKEAEKMMKETRGYKILTGYRGQPTADIDAIKKLLVKVSQVMNERTKIEELDLNPVRAFPDRVLVLDAKIIQSV